MDPKAINTFSLCKLIEKMLGKELSDPVIEIIPGFGKNFRIRIGPEDASKPYRYFRVKVSQERQG